MSTVPALSQRVFTFGEGTHASRTALRITDGLEFESWAEIGKRLLGVSEASRWWIGDWLCYGEWGRYGENYRRTLEELELAYDKVRDLAYVAGHVPEAVRRDDLSWYHHRVVAKLRPSDQELWLRRASEEAWSYRRLAEEITKAIEDLNGTSARQQEDSAGLRCAPQTELVKLDLDADRLARWRAAADASELPLQEWMIRTLDVAALASDLAGVHGATP